MRSLSIWIVDLGRSLLARVTGRDLIQILAEIMKEGDSAAKIDAKSSELVLANEMLFDEVQSLVFLPRIVTSLFLFQS